MSSSPLISISREEFDHFRPKRADHIVIFYEERAWFKTSDGRFVASVMLYIEDREDWAYWMYEVKDAQPAEFVKYGCDCSSQKQITSLLVADVKKLLGQSE